MRTIRQFWQRGQREVLRHRPVLGRGLTRRFPIAHRFQASPADARVVMFGDFLCPAGDAVPTCSREAREIFARADLVVGNCEGPVLRDAIDPGSSWLSEGMSSVFLDRTLEVLGVPPPKLVLSLANNHTCDHGDAGIDATLERLSARGIRWTGLRQDSEPLGCIASAAGLTVSVIGWTHSTNKLADRHRVLRPDDVRRVDVEALRSRHGVSCVLGTPHWDREFRHTPSAPTLAIAREFAAKGLDAIAGHHPHVLQPLEWIGRTVCAYSLGSLHGRCAGWPTRLGALLEIALTRTHGLVSYQLHPLVLDYRGPRQPLHIRLLGSSESPLDGRAQRRLETLFEASLPSDRSA